MTYYIEVQCTNYGSKSIKTIGRSAHGVGRYRYYNDSCSSEMFMLEYRYKVYVKGTKEQTIEMAVNGSRIRDTNRVFGISKSTVISTLKNSSYAAESPLSCVT